MTQPLVSVVMPVFNAEVFLDRAIGSVLRQSYKDIELLCIDDHSSDCSLEIINRWAEDDRRVRVLRTAENAGPAGARNLGIETARGDYIAFLDADDEWDTDKLNHQIAFMEANDVLLSYCDYVERDEAGRDIGFVRAPERVDHRYLMRTNAIGCSTACYDVRRLGKRFMPTVSKREDWGLWLVITGSGAVARNIDRVSVYYTVRRNSDSSDKFKSLKHNWMLYRTVLQLNRVHAAFLYAMFFYHAGIKYIRKRFSRHRLPG